MEAVATMNEYAPWGDKVRVVTVKLDKLVENWKPFKGKVVERIGEELTKPSRIMAYFQKDTERVAIWSALQKLTTSRSDTWKGIAYGHSPKQLRVMEPFKKGALSLVPMTDLNRIHAAKSNCKALYADTEWYLSPPPAWTEAVSDDKYTFVPFWWVATVNDEDEANLMSVDMKEGPVTITVLVNSKTLNKGDQLALCKAPQARPAFLGSAAKVSTHSTDTLAKAAASAAAAAEAAKAKATAAAKVPKPGKAPPPPATAEVKAPPAKPPPPKTHTPAAVGRGRPSARQHAAPPAKRSRKS